MKVMAGLFIAAVVAGQGTTSHRHSVSAGHPPVVSDSEEIALGAALAVQYDQQHGIEPMKQDAAIEAYLQSVADSLGTHTRRRLPWRVH